MLIKVKQRKLKLNHITEWYQGNKKCHLVVHLNLFHTHKINLLPYKNSALKIMSTLKDMKLSQVNEC